MKSDDYVDEYGDAHESPASAQPPLAQKPAVPEAVQPPAPAQAARNSVPNGSGNMRTPAASPYEPVSTRRSIEAPASTTPSGGMRAPVRAPVTLEPDTDPTAPISKRMFSLSANVRFTRTPDTVLQKHRNGAESATPAPAPRTERPVAAPKAAIPAPAPKGPAVAPAAAKPVASATALRTAPAPVQSGLSRAPAFVTNYAPAVVTHAAAVPVTREARPSLQTTGAQPVPQKSGSLDYLSDYAFWESMEFSGGFAAAPAAPVAKTMRKIAPDAITALFRVVELRQPHAAATETTVPAAPAPLPAAPVIPAAPAAVTAVTPQRQADPVVESAAIMNPVVDVQEEVTLAPAVVTPLPPEEPAAEEKPSRLQVTVRQEKPAITPARLAPLAVQSYGEMYERPPLSLLQEPAERAEVIITQEALEQNAGLLESVLEDFGIRGEIIHVRPGPVVTLYEFEPAPGIKSSRVIGLADDIARSMSALSARVAVVPGRNVIGIELPNATRETVYFREMIASADFESTKLKLALCLGKTIGGEPVIAELAKMPHLLVAGTTGSGKSVAINTMILSLLYRLTPEECRLIMVDPKMLELSIYDGIPHLLTPVVTDPKKAVMALKWAVREMEDRYRKMSKLGVRNIDGFNARAALAKEKGETVMCTVQTGFDKGTGEPIHEQEVMDLTPMPYIVVIVDEMADLMMVAGKDIEGAIQRLAQMARAAGIHLIMATQRPSVDVITGTIKANFPTRISFQVTSKIDSRTILGEQGAEQLLGQGDMLHMAGGGRISRVHGPFVSDEEVERVVAHLKAQGRPDYLDTVTADESEEEEPEAETGGAVFDKGSVAAEDGNELYDQAVKVVMRDKKCSTSYIQRRLQIGYNRAASLVERMEKEGLVGPSNHVGKREILSHSRDNAPFSAADSAE
ncbi:DNA translocase FtsK [Phyllobacterium myrsinacearum]|uniref:DNA translocase FtsK n=4 Tax=Pseudomonadota TaxID=1224 RepID=A0A2S9J9U5_9HYPH|nr:DNA translocase FtsK [Phyllobacterium myrsinacearum]